ncbi:putative D,D-dipeptide transport system permease protein DdpB [Ensifer sp. M14]|jgi:ABC-type dipeptide/oligopeptide/nickel transport system permease component|uniref:ABC transporter permease n=1 Tax=Ensifer sp. M14 TaxID=2203782 RepID=UPI000E1D157C|nr:ABC transporter permease [Ensifer sp. M14]RDL48296.1 putative D,D-dipeptide transport system permease protein DdpB [Ensifer sp. M14]
MGNYYVALFARRAVGFLMVLFVLSLMIFVLARIVPGDPARMALGPSATQEQVDQLRQRMGLDEPLITQYVSYVSHAVTGDLGRSIVSDREVSADIATFLPATLELVIVTIAIIFAVAVPLGVLTARYRNSWIDNSGRFFSLIGVTIPSFLFAVTLQILAADHFPSWPTLGRVDFQLGAPAGPTGFLLVDSLAAGRLDVFLSALQHLVFPALALAMAGIGQITRITRSAMIDHQRRDHVLTLKSFGVPDRVIVFRYLLKLSSIAPLTIMGLEFASLIGNAFVVEMVFSWGGFASYGLDAILQKDLNAVMAVVLVSGIFFIAANLVIDLIISFLDPRLRFKEAR